MALRITLLLATLLVIAVVHTVSINFFLYWKYVWLDIPMHVLGGVACALGYATLPFFGVKFSEVHTSLFWFLSFTLLIGLVWEVFEYCAGVSRIETDFIFDTAFDFGMDAVGGILGYVLIKNLNTIQT